MATRAARAQTPPPVYRNWLAALAANGYTVTQGSSLVSSVDYCNTVVVPVFGTCFLQDPNDPYVTTLMPQGTGYIDPYFGSMDNSILPNGVQGGSVFTLNQNEAEVVIINLPPWAGYLSYQGYVFTRPTSHYRTVAQVSPDPARADLFASYGNSVNNAGIAAQLGLPTSSWPEGTIAIISTANSALAQAVERQFQGDTSRLFADPIGMNVHVGNDSADDDFITLIRYLVPESPDLAQAWLNSVGDNVFVYRVVGPSTVPALRFRTQTLLTKSYNTNESVYAGDVSELAGLMKNWLATQETKANIIVKQSGETEVVNAQGTIVSGDVGFSCLNSGANCNADEQDGAHWNVDAGPLPARHAFVLVGVDHDVTNNSTLLSLAASDGTTATGILGFAETNKAAAGFATGVIAGSAQQALQDLGLWSQASPQLQADAPNLFVQIFSRGCSSTQTYCEYPFTTLIPTSEIPTKDDVIATARAYVLPGHLSSANPYYMLPLTLIH
jgi:hypothetical protein